MTQEKYIALENQLRLWWRLFKNEKDLVEIRVLGNNKTYSGYYKDFDKLIRDVSYYEDMPSMQVYFTLNDIADDCYGREQNEHMVMRPKITTSDNDIKSRSFILIDLDPVRKPGVNSTNEELEYAHQKARDVYKFLKENGFKNIIIARSGNGYHLDIKVSVDNSEENTNIIKRFLAAIGMMFSDDKVDVDLKVFNLARICKLYGTTAKKGANIEERPYRQSEIIKYPENLSNDDFELVKNVAEIYPEEEKIRNQYNGYQGNNNEPFNLDSFLTEHQVNFRKEYKTGVTKYILDHCFFDPQHSGKDAVLFQLDNGAISYHCFHNSCNNKTWHDVRLLLDPHAYDQKEREYHQPYRKGYYEQKPKVEIKGENEEYGKKWLSLKDIEDVNISDLSFIKTGLNKLDNDIMGLILGEITILSGGNGSGKSSWLNTVILNAIQQGFKSALWSGELPSPNLKAWLIMTAASSKYVSPSKYKGFFVPDRYKRLIEQWLDNKFWLYNNLYGNDWAQIFNDMDMLVESGVKLFVLDNLFSFDTESLSGDKNDKQKQLVIKLRDYAQKHMLHIILVAHPRKSTSFVRKEDISGSSDIANAANNILFVHRCSNDFFKRAEEYLGKAIVEDLKIYGNVVEVAKNRQFGVVDDFCGMYYDEKCRQFVNNLGDSTIYDWTDNISSNEINGGITTSSQFENNSNSQTDINNNNFFDDGNDSPF